MAVNLHLEGHGCALGHLVRLEAQQHGALGVYALRNGDGERRSRGRNDAAASAGGIAQRNREGLRRLHEAVVPNGDLEGSAAVAHRNIEGTGGQRVPREIARRRVALAIAGYGHAPRHAHRCGVGSARERDGEHRFAALGGICAAAQRGGDGIVVRNIGLGASRRGFAAVCIHILVGNAALRAGPGEGDAERFGRLVQAIGPRKHGDIEVSRGGVCAGCGRNAQRRFRAGGEGVIAVRAGHNARAADCKADFRIGAQCRAAHADPEHGAARRICAAFDEAAVRGVCIIHPGNGGAGGFVAHNAEAVVRRHKAVERRAAAAGGRAQSHAGCFGIFQQVVIGGADDNFARGAAGRDDELAALGVGRRAGGSGDVVIAGGERLCGGGIHREGHAHILRRHSAADGHDESGHAAALGNVHLLSALAGNVDVGAVVIGDACARGLFRSHRGNGGRFPAAAAGAVELNAEDLPAFQQFVVHGGDGDLAALRRAGQGQGAAGCSGFNSRGRGDVVIAGLHSAGHREVHAPLRSRRLVQRHLETRRASILCNVAASPRAADAQGGPVVIADARHGLAAGCGNRGRCSAAAAQPRTQLHGEALLPFQQFILLGGDGDAACGIAALNADRAGGVGIRIGGGGRGDVVIFPVRGVFAASGNAEGQQQRRSRRVIQRNLEGRRAAVLGNGGVFAAARNAGRDGIIVCEPGAGL